jgi:hypothetical protein
LNLKLYPFAGNCQKYLRISQHSLDLQKYLECYNDLSSQIYSRLTKETKF